MKRATYRVVDKQTKKRSKPFINKTEAKAHRNDLQSATTAGLPLAMYDENGKLVNDPRPVASNWRFYIETVR